MIQLFPSMIRVLALFTASSTACTTSTDSSCTPSGPVAARQLLQTIPAVLGREDQASHLDTQSLSDGVALRPHEGGPADVIQVDVALKAFFGADLHNEAWEGDLVLMLSWHDPRAAGLVPKEHQTRTLSQQQAQKLLWTPDVEVTNIELDGFQVISTSYVVSLDGVVNKTQRVLVKIKEDFDGKQFPYDEQALNVRLASTSYMVDDVQLVAAPGTNLTNPGAEVFDHSDWTYLGHGLTVFEEMTGTLRKSRAQFQIQLKRDATPYLSYTIFPEIMIVVLSYTVFLFPVTPAFAMPRVSSAVIAFLSILTISTRTTAMLPEVRRGLVWMELFEVTCKMLLFSVILLNILVEMVFHTWQQPELAVQLIKELRLGFPVVAGVSIAACWRAAGTRLELCCQLQRCGLLLVLVMFLISVIRRSRKYAALQEK
ncbi:unnamed protein product [Effrenium voratum]|uniref:Neurotransmitter-gated ion-channel ligand-binding domain-containing protein n=1 Tax=Effrenium voratum TaxID=2562239 RepID=A0AA36I2C7_9DINO|nr:unnamed protein product [Effrenium voratum]CAJ1459156.1 unnamed protein product [Effrenium voratum]